MTEMTIEKTLSANDIGKTGAHQAGILVPKQEELLSFFPELDNREKNPRIVLRFLDENGKIWEFMFIYYNNKFFDDGGTRNEYRLTRMTGYIREKDLCAGDKLVFKRDETGTYKIKFIRMSSEDIYKDKGNKKSESENMDFQIENDVLILKNGWVSIKKRK